MMRTPFSKQGTEACYATPLQKKKKKRNPNNWQVKKRKAALNSGKVYTWKKRNGELKVLGRERPVGARCPDSCKRDCNSITEEDRMLINQSYWKMGDAELHRGFLLKYVTRFQKKEKGKVLGQQNPRKSKLVVQGKKVNQKIRLKRE